MPLAMLQSWWVFNGDFLTSLFLTRFFQSNGIGDRAGKADKDSGELLQNARSALTKVQSDLEPHLNRSAEAVGAISKLNSKTEKKLEEINQYDGVVEKSHAKSHSFDLISESSDSYPLSRKGKSGKTRTNRPPMLYKSPKRHWSTSYL